MRLKNCLMHKSCEWWSPFSSTSISLENHFFYSKGQETKSLPYLTCGNPFCISLLAEKAPSLLFSDNYNICLNTPGTLTNPCLNLPVSRSTLRWNGALQVPAPALIMTVSGKMLLSSAEAHEQRRKWWLLTELPSVWAWSLSGSAP